MLPRISLATGNIDESINVVEPIPSRNNTTSNSVDTEAIETRIEVEDALLEMGQVIEPKVMMHGKEIPKARALSDFSKF